MQRLSWVRNLLVGAGILVLAGCASSSGVGSLSSRDGSGEDDIQLRPEDFLVARYCPIVEVRPGTETHREYVPGGEGEANQVRIQATLGETARECSSPAPGVMRIKLGFEGRVVAGPAGGPGEYRLPLRVAAVRQSDGAVLYSQALIMPVVLSAALSVSFRQVFDQVEFQLAEGDRDIIVFIGYDEQGG